MARTPYGYDGREDCRTRVTSGFRLPDRKDHNGIDTKRGPGGTLSNTSVFSPVSGIVVLANNGYNYGRGTTVIVQWMVDGVAHRLRAQHLADFYVQVGDTITEGQLLGKEGWTGNVDPPNANGTHTHWEYTVGGTLQSYGEIKGAAICDPAPLLGIKNVKGQVFEPYGWAETPYSVHVEYASIGDLANLVHYCLNANIDYKTGPYNGYVTPAEGNKLETITMYPTNKEDFIHLVQMCDDATLTTTLKG